MIVKADKFQATILNKDESEAKYMLTIDNNDVKSTKSVILLGITNDDRLWFDQHISNLCSKAAINKCFRLTSEIYGKIWKSGDSKYFYLCKF